MTKYILARVTALVPTLLLLLFVVVALLRLLPGNAADLLLAESSGSGEANRAQVEADLGIDQPLPKAYLDYSLGAAHGDLGNSLWSRKPVAGIIARKFGVTLELALLSLVIGCVTGVAIGVVSAVMQSSPIDYALRSFAVLGISIPNFVLATIVIVMPTLWWGWSPPITYTAVGDDLIAHLSQFIVPATLLGFGLSTVLMRLTRTTMLDVLRQDYIRTARAKGLSNRTVIISHGLRNAMIPVVTITGLQVGALISGSVLLERMFGLPGIGNELLTAVGTRDYPLIQGIAVVAGAFVIAINLLVDLSYGLIDPRIRVDD